MEKLLNEINKSRSLMGLKELNEILVSDSKNLLLESSIKPKFSFPNVKFEGKSIDNFNQLKKYANFKGVDLHIKSIDEFNKFKSDIPNIDQLINRFKEGSLYRNFLESNYILRGSKVDPGVVGATGEILRSIKNKAGKGAFGNIKGTEIPTPRQELLNNLSVVEKWDNTFGFRDEILWAYRQADPEGFEKLMDKFTDGDAAIKSILKREVPDTPVNTKNLDNKIKSKTDPATGQKYKPNDVKQKWKAAGGNETKLEAAWDKGWRPGLDPKKFDSSKPPKKISGGFEEGTIGYKISSETDPKTGEPYDPQIVKNEFGSTGSFDDNALLNNAWDDPISPWRPGMEVPEKYQTEFYKFKQSQKSVNNRPEVKADMDLRTLIEGPDKKKPLHNYEKVYDEFGVDEGNIDHMDKLKGAWEKGWRPGKRIDGEYSEFKIKDTDKVCRRLITDPNGKNNIDPKTSKPYDYENVKEQFGSNGINPDHNKKLYEAWEDGWRPPREVEPQFQTDLYKAAKQGDVSIPFPDVTPKTRNWFQLVYDKVKSHMWGRSLGQLEDLTYSFTNNPRTLATFEDAVKGYINEWAKQGQYKSRGDISWIREEFLKIQRNEKLKNQISLDTLDTLKGNLKLEIKNDIRFQNDPLKIKNLETTVDEFFTELIGEKGIDGTLAWVFENSKKMDNYTDFGKNGIWKVFLYGVEADIPSGGKAKVAAIVKRLLYRAWTSIVGGSVWSSKEALLIRNSGNFHYKSAAIQFGLRMAFSKIIIPGLFISSLQYLWQSIWNGGQSKFGNYDDNESKSWLEFAWENIKQEWSADGTKSNLGEVAWGIIKAVTPGDLESIAENVITFVEYWKTDRIKDQYKIRYEDPTLGWISYPKVKDVYESFEDVQEKIKNLESSGVKKICDATDYKKNTTLEPLVINASVKVVCPGSTEKTYNIVNDKCVDPNDGTGEFKNIASCETQRTLRKLKYTCKDGTCVQDDNGEYANYLTCQASSANNDGKCKSKDKENNKKEEEKTIVNGEQTADFLRKVVKGRTDGGKIWSDSTVYVEQPSINYKGNKAWTVRKGDTYFIYSIDKTYNCYEKKHPADKWGAEHLNDIRSDNGWVLIPSNVVTTQTNTQNNSDQKNKVDEAYMTYKLIKKITSTEMKLGNRRRIFEEKDEKFGEEKFEHWKKTFEFSSQDPETKEWKRIEKETVESKQVEIEKWVDHYLKSNDEDDAFVRAVIHVFKLDKNPKNHVKKVSFNKGLAHLSENFEVGGLLKVISVIRESKELEIWSVKYYADGNWELVKGSFNDEELKNVGKTVRERDKKEEERKKPVEGLKKKELTGIQLLNQDEKQGLTELPKQVQRKLLEKLRNGWVTEKPYEFFNEFYSVSNINTIFNEKLKIYKLNPSKEFFNSLVKNSPRIFPRKGICKALSGVENDENINDRSKSVLNHILQKCQTKFKGEYGVKQIKTN